MVEPTELSAMPLDDLDPQWVGQIVLRWEQAHLLKHLRQPASALPADAYFAAMQGLVQRIVQLQSAHAQPQGPIQGSIQDPEVLLPLVLPEARAVLQQMRQLSYSTKTTENPGFQPGSHGAVFAEPAAFWNHPTQPIRALASRLLWSIAQSTHETVQLLEGITAQVSSDRQTWQFGMVRLVACLEIQTVQTDFSLDLVTFQSSAPGLPDEDFIQTLASSSSLFGQSTPTVQALLQRLTPHLTAAAPILKPFLAGLPVDLLIPHYPWQAGQIWLRLQLEFIPTASPHANGDSDLATAERGERLPAIQFTHPSWLEQYITTVVENQLAQILSQSFSPMAPSAGEESAALLPILQQSCALIDTLQGSLTLASRTVAQQVLPLDELALRVLWGMNRTAYEVMQWLSGVEVRLLPPQQGWTTGMLRFAVYLEIQTPEQTWRFDLVQRCLRSDRPMEMAEDAVVQFRDEGCFQMLTLGNLATALWQQISQTAPELLLLRSATEVNVTTGTSDGQVGVLSLHTAFEFSAAGSFSAA